MEKPLHVRVAEAIGWAECQPFEADGIYDYENWCGESPREGDHLLPCSSHGFVPRYDTDWSATGPLIDARGICLFQDFETKQWAAGVWGHYGLRHGWFPTALTAACELIIASPAAGTLGGRL